MALASPHNLCGSCTMCCKTAGITELAKPPGAWCPNCDKGRGCRIYETRPPTCRDFACTWLQVRSEGGAIADALRPDRCHVVFFEVESIPGTVMAQVDPAYPDAWRSGPAMRLMADYAGSGTTVSLTTGKYHVVIDATGIHQGRVVETDAMGNQKVVKDRKIGRVLNEPGPNFR